MTEERRQAPTTLFKAAGSGRMVALGGFGVPAVVMCVTQQTGAGAAPLAAAVREKYPDISRVVMVTVVDVSSVPRLFRKVAEGTLGGRYNETAKGLDPGRDPADWVFILPDWEGTAAPGLGLGDPGKAMGVAVLDAAGRVAGTHEGEDGAAEPVLALLAALA